MRSSYYSLVVLMAGLFFASCKKDSLVDGLEYQKSLAAWIDFKESSGNSYRYTVTTSSWAGSRSETVITVRAGKVTNRSFVSTYAVNNATPSIRDQWEEDESTLNTHTAGAETVTLDEIYKKAKTHWLVRRDNATTYFEAKNNGLISLCGFVPEGCQDDCFSGIHISRIEKI